MLFVNWRRRGGRGENANARRSERDSGTDVKNEVHRRGRVRMGAKVFCFLVIGEMSSLKSRG